MSIWDAKVVSHILVFYLQDCETSDVRRSYRKLSLVLHPDKNKQEDAEAKFRQVGPRPSWTLSTTEYA